MMTLMLVVRENYISVVITHSAAFYNVPVGETLYLSIIKQKVTGIRQCILKLEIHRGEQKTYLLISFRRRYVRNWKYTQMEM